VDDRVFVRYLATRLEVADDGRGLVGAERAADLYLACACLQHDAKAIAEFERAHLARAKAYLRSYGSPAFVEDVLQDLRERLLVGGPDRPPRISEYAPRGPLGAWVRVVATRLALDRNERAERERPMAEPPEELVDARDPELQAIKSQHGADFMAAVREAVASLERSERAILRLYLIDRLNVAEIGAILGTSRATAARRVAQCRERVLDETRRRLEERLQLSRSDAESLMRVHRSQLEVSVSGLLRSQ
jgi:RNA polymerase sigma-70 factor (ECF subfamily)